MRSWRNEKGSIMGCCMGRGERRGYDFMKKLVVEGRNLLETLSESIGQVVEKGREGFRR